MSTTTEQSLKEQLRARVERSSFRAVANELGVSHALIFSVVRHDDSIGEGLARAMGYERRVTYRRLARSNGG